MDSYWKRPLLEEHLEVRNGDGNTYTLQTADVPVECFEFIGKLLVRTEYLKLHSLLLEAANNWKRRFAILGQSAAGKSIFIIYLLLRRMATGLSTVVCFKSYGGYLFCDDGQNHLNLIRLDNNGRERVQNMIDSGALCNDCWVLYDDEVNEQVMELFPANFSVLAASLEQRNCWFVRRSDNKFYVKNLTFDEVYLISVFKYNLDKNKLLRVKQICRKFGNNCRIALHEDVITGKDEVYHQYLKYLEFRLRVSICEYLKGSLTDEERLIYSAPSAIAVLEPSDDDIRQRGYNLVFPSFYVKRKLQDIVKKKGKAFLTTFLGEMRDSTRILTCSWCIVRRLFFAVFAKLIMAHTPISDYSKWIETCAARQ